MKILKFWHTAQSQFSLYEGQQEESVPPRNSMSLECQETIWGQKFTGVEIIVQDEPQMNDRLFDEVIWSILTTFGKSRFVKVVCMCKQKK